MDTRPSWESEIQVHKNSFQPLYLQVKEGLEAWIRNGLREETLSPGDRIPSEAELCSKLDISQITAKRALEELRRQGLIERFQGRGSFITGQSKIVLSLSSLFSLTSVTQKKGFVASRRTLQLAEQNAWPALARQLNIPVNASVIRLVRLRLMDHVPVVIDTSYLPLFLFPGFLTEYRAENSLYEMMAEKYGHGPVRTQDVLEPIVIKQDEAEILEVQAGSPAILIERTAFGMGDVPLEFTKSIFRGDLFRFSVETFRE